MGLRNWRNKLLLDLPMRAADHDPVNDWSVNRGRAGAALNAAFGAGVAEPTKLGYRRGYYFDGINDRMDPSAGYQLTTGRLSALIMIDCNPDGAADVPFNWETSGGDCVFTFYFTVTEWRFYSGSFAALNNAARAVKATEGLSVGVPFTSVGTWDGTNTTIYVNGRMIATAVTPVAPAATSLPISIGTRSDGSSWYTGNIYHVGMADFALSPMQVSMYHREMMKKFSKI